MDFGRSSSLARDVLATGRLHESLRESLISWCLLQLPTSIPVVLANPAKWRHQRLRNIIPKACHRVLPRARNKTGWSPLHLYNVGAITASNLFFALTVQATNSAVRMRTPISSRYIECSIAMATTSSITTSLASVPMWPRQVAPCRRKGESTDSSTGTQKRKTARLVGFPFLCLRQHRNIY